MTASQPVTDWTDSWEDSPARVRPTPRRDGAREPRTARAQVGSRPARARAPRTRSPRASSERARRQHHLRALRRDALIDFVAAFVAMVVILIVTSGLGVVALLEIALAAIVVASLVIERRRRRRLRR